MIDPLPRLSGLEFLAVLFAVLYLLLAIRRNIWCWPFALVSAALSAVVFFRTQLYMESILQVFYAAMAIYGWIQWMRGRTEHGLAITTWTVSAHIVVISSILMASGLCAWALSHTSQAMPYVDSFTTIAAIVATFMVAHKVLENWFYWFVIDSVSIYMYYARELPLYALLFVVYLVLIVIGYKQWHRAWVADAEAAAPASA